MTTRPNIVFIMSDDHAAHAISAYDSILNQTPNIDRIADEGTRANAVFCTNAICSPSRASILTGTYSHVNGLERLQDTLDQRQVTVDKLLRSAGYQTAVVGKWHLGHGLHHDPAGFDYWAVLPGQGEYHDPVLIEDGVERQFHGYVTDIVTDLALAWLAERDPSRPFFLMLHHKAPHRPWEPDEAHANRYRDVQMPEPETFDDDYATRSSAAKAATMRILEEIVDTDTKGPPPDGLAPEELKRWKYQAFIKDYLRCVDSVDDNVGRVLEYLDREGLVEDTVVVYTSDQGFFLGDHGWFDKRFFYEESVQMPFVVRYPHEIPAGGVTDEMILNVDFAPLFCDYAEVPAAAGFQGRSPRRILAGQSVNGWREDMYYRYFDYPGDVNTYAHYGVRTAQHKLIYFYEPGPPEWELFDLYGDPNELNNVYDNPDFAEVRRRLTRRLAELRAELGDRSAAWDGEQRALATGHQEADGK